jgi:hypothetical protein
MSRNEDIFLEVLRIRKGDFLLLRDGNFGTKITFVFHLKYLSNTPQPLLLEGKRGMGCIPSNKRGQRGV